MSCLSARGGCTRYIESPQLSPRGSLRIPSLPHQGRRPEKKRRHGKGRRRKKQFLKPVTELRRANTECTLPSIHKRAWTFQTGTEKRGSSSSASPVPLRDLKSRFRGTPLDPSKRHRRAFSLPALDLERLRAKLAGKVCRGLASNRYSNRDRHRKGRFSERGPQSCRSRWRPTRRDEGYKCSKRPTTDRSPGSPPLRTREGSSNKPKTVVHHAMSRIELEDASTSSTVSEKDWSPRGSVSLPLSVVPKSRRKSRPKSKLPPVKDPGLSCTGSGLFLRRPVPRPMPTSTPRDHWEDHPISDDDDDVGSDDDEVQRTPCLPPIKSSFSDRWGAPSVNALTLSDMHKDQLGCGGPGHRPSSCVSSSGSVEAIQSTEWGFESVEQESSSGGADIRPLASYAGSSGSV